MESDGWRRFLQLCLKLSDLKQADEFFTLFFTPEEKEDMKKRVEIVEALLKEELTQREIARKNHVSIAKITRGSNALKNITNKLREYLK